MGRIPPGAEAADHVPVDLFLTVLFAAAFGQQVTQDRTVPVFSEEMDQEEVDRMVERLSGYEPASFEAVEADEALRKSTSVKRTSPWN